MIETLPPIWCSRILFPIPPWPWLMLIQFISEYIYNAYCFVHKHHERTFLRRKPCYRRRRWWRKKIQIQWKFLRRKTWQQQKKNKKRKNFPFQKNIFVFIFRARQKVLFSVKLSSFSPLFHCRLVGAVVTPSLVIQKMLLPPHISPVFFLYYY